MIDSFFLSRWLRVLVALFLIGAASQALADDKKPAPPSLWVPTQALAGKVVQIEGYRFQPGQEVALYRAGQKLATGPVTVDEKGQFKTAITLPASLPPGLQPIAVRAAGKTLLVHQLMVSEVLPPQGADSYAIKQQKLSPGLYQVAYSASQNALFVTHSSRKPYAQTGIIKVNPDSMQVIADNTLKVPEKGANKTSSIYAVFGLAADSARQTLWVTNSLQNTVAVYRQSDLSLLKQFKADSVPHAHSVVVNSKLGRAYVSAYTSGEVAVFDTTTLKHIADIDLSANTDKVNFKPVGLAFSHATGKLYVGAGPSAKVAVIDMATNKLDKVFSLGTKGKLRGLAWDADDKLLLATSFNTDQLLAIDPDDEDIEQAVYVGSRPLAVVWNPVTGLAYVGNRGAGTLVAVSIDKGKRVAVLEAGTQPNDLVLGSGGVVFAVNKSTGPKDPRGDLLTRLNPVSVTD